MTEQKAGGAGVGDDPMPAVLSWVSEEYRPAVKAALKSAGDNAPELVETLQAVTKDQRKAAAFLIANMPEADLRSLKKNFLVENIALAFKARAESPWGRDLPEEMFLNYVLPYANVDERREDWRGDFLKRFAPLVWKCKTPAEAVQRLNRYIYKDLGVQYHATQRPKPNQSPCESVEAKYASCTGLSILLVDACRAVGVPARLAGTPLWTDRKGNHTWTEIWDGRWHYVGSAEPSDLDKTWFTGSASKADESKWQHRIYAVSYRRTGACFPMVWNLGDKGVPGIDVTRFYTAPREATVEVPAGAESAVTVRRDGEIVAAGRGKGKMTFTLAGGLTYDVEVVGADGKVCRSRLEVPAAK